jgi:hypothetical protein
MGRDAHLSTLQTYDDGAARLSAHQGIDLSIFRKSAELFLGESEPTVYGDLEYTGDPFDELDLLRAAFHEPGLRTEGPRFIVSRHAVFYPDLHCTDLIRSQTPQLITTGPPPPLSCTMSSMVYIACAKQR